MNVVLIILIFFSRAQGQQPAVPYMAGKPDLAVIDRQLPVDPTVLAGLQPSDLTGWTQEKFDQLYARLSAGPIPRGPFETRIIFTDEGGWKKLARMILPFQNLGSLHQTFALMKWVSELFWSSKNFTSSQNGRRTVRNLLLKRPETEAALSLLKGISAAKLAGITTINIADLNGQKFTAYELFPAKVYCGQSLFDSRRESVIMDQAFNEDLDVRIPELESIAGRKGLAIRDEMRMIRPGFYLGRAYSNKVFAFNFTLYNRDQAETGETCWSFDKNP